MIDIDIIQANNSTHQEIDQLMIELQEDRINGKIRDTLIFVEHPEIVTIGRRGMLDGLTAPDNFPSSQVDRGGGLTWHGPGQLVIYALVDLKKRSLKPRIFIKAFYQAIFESIHKYQTNLKFIDSDPGIYYDEKKLVSFGLKINKKGTYHGASINVSMNMDPWNEITICGDKERQAIDLEHLGCNVSLEELRGEIKINLSARFE